MKEVRLSTIIAVAEDDETLAKEAAKMKLLATILKSALENNTRSYVNVYFKAEVLKSEPPTWAEQVDRAARDLIRDNFIPEIVDLIMDGGEASSDINNDYANGDGIFHETIVDTDYDAEEAMELLHELSSFEEDDSGLWEGKDWEDILRIKAAYTFGNAVASEFEDLIATINEIDLAELIKQAVKAAFKELKPFKIDAQERERIELDDLETWLNDRYNGICEKHLRAILEKEIEEVIS